jgi:hypothetical protein
MPETGHNTISEMMQGYAAEAVRLASEHDAELDYSESSLQDVEAILAKMYSNLAKTTIGTASPSQDSAQQKLDSTSRIWGAYFGETIRRLWGGEWGVETYPGSLAPVISIDIGGAKLFPVMKVHRRLTQGDADNVWAFYQMVRKKIASGQRQ